MRIATLNLESLDEPIAPRVPILVPALDRLDADVLCLQEINGQKSPGDQHRTFAALDQLLEGTEYAEFHRSTTTSGDSAGASSVHNLVTLSRFPIVSQRQVLHDYLAPQRMKLHTPAPQTEDLVELRFDRPLLLSEVEANGRRVHIINVHLRAPLASRIPGQKISPFSWKSVGAWAEGYHVSGLKRAGQALELRLLVDHLFDRDPLSLIVIAGDFNVQDHETPLRIVLGAAEDTGNSDLASRSLIVLDRALPPARRFSVLHHGRPQMLDHMVASHAMYGRFRDIVVHNEALGDEAVGFALGLDSMGSYHAGLVATFSF
ncbi:MAG: endonuclease/exonuclease/phosphatase family protein [Hyphomicrobiaceae bacterium]